MIMKQLKLAWEKTYSHCSTISSIRFARLHSNDCEEKINQTKVLKDINCVM